MIYRAVGNRYDKLRSPIEPYVDYKISEVTKSVAVIFNRAHKMFPPQAQPWTLYLDGSMTPNEIVAPIVDGWLENHYMALFKHPHRTCVYAELQACVRRGKCGAREAKITEEYLRDRKIPEDGGLFACGVIARRSPLPSPIERLMRRWWREFMFLSSSCPRDQIALMLALHDEQWVLEHINVIDADIFDNPWFTYRRHGT